jgi:hypothetical protein
MKLTTLIIALTFAANCSAQTNYDNRPQRLFFTNKNEMLTNEITWIGVDSNKVVDACNRESKRRGLGGFTYEMVACSFQSKNKCTIITSNAVSMHIVGHEVLHCFQGAWHDEPK